MKKTLRVFWLYAALVGFVTFPLFILEESIQMATWGTWAAKDGKNPQLQLKGAQLIDRLNIVMTTINRVAGWIQPLSMLGYDGYSQATDYYVESVKSKLLAQDPEVFLNQHVEFEFTPKEIAMLQDGTVLFMNGKIGTILKPDKNYAIGRSIHISGILTDRDGKFIVIPE